MGIICYFTGHRWLYEPTVMHRRICRRCGLREGESFYSKDWVEGLYCNSLRRFSKEEIVEKWANGKEF